MGGALLDRLPQRARVAVIRLRSLGDCVLTAPALSLLKAHRPDLEIAMVVEDRFRGVFEDNPSIAAMLPAEASAIARWRPMMVLNVHGGTRSMWMTTASRARIRAGFAHHAYSFLYNARIPRAQETLGEERPVHTAEHLASAVFWMGVPQADIPRARLFAPPSPRRQPYAALHPFASAPEKAWGSDRFVAVAQHLRAIGLEPVILAGPADDTTPFTAFDVLHNASLREVKSILSGAQLFIGNDSGPAHIAAAFGVPVVVLFGPSNPVTWAPWRTEAQVLTSPEGMAAISVAQVTAAAESLRVRT
jgi:ADP-heptose:LPS heptosyltransferase